MNMYEVGDVVNYQSLVVTIKTVNGNGFLGVPPAGYVRTTKVEPVYSIFWFDDLKNDYEKNSIPERDLKLISKNPGYYNFKIDDNVILKSGGPRMIVEAVDSFDPSPITSQNRGQRVYHFCFCKIEGVDKILKIYNKLLMPL